MCGLTFGERHCVVCSCQCPANRVVQRYDFTDNDGYIHSTVVNGRENIMDASMAGGTADCVKLLYGRCAWLALASTPICQWYSVLHIYTAQ
jgi:hypothetical protein